MAYTPELSQICSATLRRLAWYMGKPMTKSLEMLIGMTAMKMAEIRPGEICLKCKDNSICEECPFYIPAKSNPTLNPGSKVPSSIPVSVPGTGIASPTDL